MKITISGPTRSGKTTYLAALTRATFAMDMPRPILVQPVAGDLSAQSIQDGALDVLQGRPLAATERVQHARMIAHLPGSLLFGLGAEQLEITLQDPPGGDCLPPPPHPVSEEVAGAACDADGLLLLVPADDMHRPPDLAARFEQLVNTVRIRRNLPEGRPPFSRIAVCVAMAELLVRDERSNALHTLEELDPRKVALDLLGPHAEDVLQQSVAQGGDWYSLISVFGFDRRTGAAAAERDANGNWRLPSTINAEKDDWFPYRLFEPIEFLARGMCWRDGV